MRTGSVSLLGIAELAGTQPPTEVVQTGGRWLQVEILCEIEAYSIRPDQDADRLMSFRLKRNRMSSDRLPHLVSARPTGKRFVPRHTMEL
jgi:hypothetical protein